MKVGVVVGRFQVPSLSEGHRSILDAASSETDVFIVVVGVTEVLSRIDPLDFHSRALMIQEEYPKASIVPLKDHPDNKIWVKNLDSLISSTAGNSSISVYGGRDSFLGIYKASGGIYTTVEINQTIEGCSGTILRSKVSSNSPSSPGEQRAFREGMIHASNKRYPTSFQAVDLAVIRKDLPESSAPAVLLVRRHFEEKFRLPGGFVDPDDRSLEEAAKREGIEELGPNLNFDAVHYFSSYRIDDYRFTRNEHGIMSALFTSKFLWGVPKVNEEIAEFRWIHLANIREQMNISREHIKMLQELADYYEETAKVAVVGPPND